MGERYGHQALAGAIGGSAVVCGAAMGPLWATAFDLMSAVATAGIAARAVEEVASERGLLAKRALASAVREVTKQPDAPLAAHAVELVCRVRARDPRVLRSIAMLVGRATTARAGGLVLQLFGSWCAPLRDLANLGAPLAAARAAMQSGELVRAMTDAIPAPLVPLAPVTVALEDVDAAPPESGRFPLGTFATFSGNSTLEEAA